ncbi:1,2-dihydroxy-3-keto-5-methylthiopentene dioxygenase [Trichonephila clavipes]|nr:1,2-dihydroxy-3-keto-5-methylthiopentene dioxygenase [Trichonephila clavipes]
MPQAWYMDDSSENPRSEHHLNPPQFVQIEKLYDLSGVEYWHVDVDNIEKEEQFAELKKSRGYDYEDLCEVSREALPDYDEKIKAFSTEHLHTDEEIRLFLAGSGYFDIRDKYDKWIRIKVSKGDLLVLPAGIYHRFTLDMGAMAPPTITPAVGVACRCKAKAGLRRSSRGLHRREDDCHHC